jgi:phage gpG-like protein
MDVIFTEKAKRVAKFMRDDFPRIVGVEAVRHFKQSFQDEGFTDETLVKWQDVQRRQPEYQKLTLKKGKKKRSPKFTKADRTRKILTGPTGDLGDSLDWNADFNAVKITSDSPYAQAHNEGTNNAGRGRSTRLPKRQFMGDSRTLIKELNERLDAQFNQIFNAK